MRMTRTRLAVAGIAVALAGGLLPVGSAQAAPAGSVRTAAPDTGTVRGTVTDPAGRPLAGIRVYVIFSEFRYVSPGLTPADGTFSFTIDTVGRATIGFVDERLRQHAVATRAGVTVPDGGAVTVDGQMSLGTTIRGNFMRPDSRGTSGLTVFPIGLDLSEVEGQLDFRHRIPVAEDGTWTFTGALPGRYRFLWRDASGQWLDQCVGATGPDRVDDCRGSGRAYAVSGEVTDLGTQRMGFRAPTVTGTIRGVGNRPLLRAWVVDQDSDDSDEGGVWVTDAAGRYEVLDRGCPACVALVPNSTRYQQARLPLPAVGVNQQAVRNVRLRSRTVVRARARVGRRKATVVVAVTPQVAAAVRSGVVVVRYKTTNGASVTRKARISRTGRASIHLPRARSGKRSFTVSYKGNADAVGTTVRITARVK